MRKNNWRSGEQRSWNSHRHYTPHWHRGRYSNCSYNERQERSAPGTSRSVATTPAVRASNPSETSSVPELPGFYYDPEKDRYFRLLPGHNNCNPLTKESIGQKEMERRRLKLLEEDDKPGKKTPRTGLNSTLLLQNRSLGMVSPASYCRLVHEQRVSSMRRQKLNLRSSDSTSDSAEGFKLIVADSACERIFTVNDVEHGGCKYGIMDIKRSGKGTLSAEMCDNLYFTNRKVNSISWASVSHHDSHVLLCLVGMADTPGCVSLLPASLFSNSNPGGGLPSLFLSRFSYPAYTSCWLQVVYITICFTSSLSRCVLVTDAVTGRRQTFGTNSDVLAQRFALQSPVLFNGCRSGEIFSIDIRQRTRKGQSWKESCFYHGSAVTAVHLLQDENYLVASDMAGKIKLWDLRVRSCVKQFEGHHNEYAYLPLHLNEEEGMLLAVGQDCYTRIWSLQDARLLRTIPSPLPASKTSIPSVVFSSQLGGQQGLPGLLMAVRRDLYYYSYNTEYQD
uniref:Uncharacterized protein n=1 Tax=Latimeria chalumnae TaxID=7897 RepID=H3AXU3_LATCH